MHWFPCFSFCMLTSFSADNFALSPLHVWALANDQWLAFFFREVARGGFLWLFWSPQRLGVLVFCLRCLSQTTFTTRAFDVLRQYPTPNCGLHTGDFAATGILLLQNCSRPRPRLTTDCPAFRTGTAATTAAATATAAPATTIGELRSELLLRFWYCGFPAVEGADTRLHKHTRSHQTTP